MIFLIIFLLLQSKAHPTPIFVIVPILCAVVCGFDFTQIAEFMKTGVTTTMPVAVLFIFSIVYFSIMSEVGLFDPLVDFLVKRAGSNVILVTVATACIATIAHLDGALAATLLVTIPAMLPIYKKLNTDVNALWHTLIPLQIVGIVMVLVFAAFMGVLEKRRGAGVHPTGKAAELDEDASSAHQISDEEAAALKRPKLFWFNLLLTVGVVALLCFTKIQLYAAFMIGLSFALIVNFPDPKMQGKRIKAHAGEALGVPMILLASGVFLGVLTGTKMMDAMAETLVMLIPTVLGPYFHIIMGIFAVPIGMMLGTSPYFFGLMPLAIGVGEQYGITPENMSNAMLVGKNFAVLVTPHAATTFLCCGLAGVSIKELLRFCTPWLWGLSIISLFFAIVLGIVTI